MRTSVEKVRPESNNFACLGKIIKEKAISKESCCSLRQGWFEIAFLLWVCGMEAFILKNYKIAVAGTGYVGLSIATLLSQYNQVTAVDIIPEKVDLINQKKFPIQDDYIEKYLAEKELNLTATLDAEAAYTDADFVVIAAPTNVYSTNRIDVATSKRTCFAHYIGY